MVRFSRLRLSVRLLTRAPFDLLVSLYHARGDFTSWISAVKKDVVWLSTCIPEAKYTFTEWCRVVRSSPKAARTLIRKACETVAAQSLVVGEASTAVKKPDSAYTCWCGAVFYWLAAYRGHQGTVHQEWTVATWFACTSNTCGCCLVQFSNRALLITHMTRGRGICFLNAVLRRPTITHAELMEIRRTERLAQAKREKVGLPRYQAVSPLIRVSGPLSPIVDLNGDVILDHSNMHPFGPQQRKYLYVDEDELTGE